MKKKKPSHTTMGNNSFRCLHCGQEYDLDTAFAQGTTLGMVAAMAEAFAKDHAACQPSERGRARFEFKTPDEWLRSWDTGLSSISIWHYMMQAGKPKGGYAVPEDPADFGRCHRLLAAFPAWRAKIGEMAGLNERWAKVAPRWSEFEALYLEEAPTGRCVRLFDALASCR